MTTNNRPLIGLLWFKPPGHTLAVAAQHARRRFVERDGRQPAAVLLNPQDVGQLPSDAAPTLAGLPVVFDKMVRPGHLFMLAPDPQEKKVRSFTQKAADQSPTTPKAVNQ